MKLATWLTEWHRKRKIIRLRRKIMRINDPVIENILAFEITGLIDECYYNHEFKCARPYAQRGDCPPECVYSPSHIR
jgi:hypothetical protein